MIWRNGDFLDDDQAVIRWTDPGFVHGVTVVDNCRTWNRKLFRWQDHLERFRRDCRTCFVPLNSDDAELTAAAQRLIFNHPEDVHVITFATPEAVGMHLKPVPVTRNHTLRTAGAVLVVAGIAVNSPLQPATVKHRSRLQWHTAAMTLTDRDAWAVLTDAATGSLLETEIGSLMARRGDVMIIPPRDRVLPGIGLAVVREFCTARGWPVEEATIHQTDAEITEFLMVGSGIGVCGVRRVNDREWPCPGPWTRSLIQDWARATA
jgi:branched-chain amino acid aminotransferase